MKAKNIIANVATEEDFVESLERIIGDQLNKTVKLKRGTHKKIVHVLDNVVFVNFTSKKNSNKAAR